MFDAHILFYCYDNEQGDEFAVGTIGNKEDWCYRMNTWNRNDGVNHKYTVEEWDELEINSDLRGSVLAEVIPEDNEYVVNWVGEDNENSVRIKADKTIVWETNNTGKDSIPRWVNSLKKRLKELQS